jgi:hypothetical protein
MLDELERKGRRGFAAPLYSSVQAGRHILAINQRSHGKSGTLVFYRDGGGL